MLSIGLLYIDGWEYYANLAAEDYHSNGGEKPGQWWGKGAKALGLKGTVKRSHLRALFRGFKPGTGEALVQNAGRRNRRAGLDLTFNAPKPASVLIGAGPVPKVEVPRLHDIAVKSALQRLQDTLAFTRVGSVSKGECRLEKADVLVAIYDHAVSRENEMHRHSHCLLINAAFNSDEKTRCLHTKLIFPEKKLLGAWYRAKLAELLRKELRIACVRKEESFEIPGVPQSLIQANSTRREQIKAHLRKTGEHGGKAAAKACLETRRTKQDTEPHEKLHEKWRRECRAHGLSPRAFARIQRAKLWDPQKVLPKALARATKNLTCNGGHFSEHDMLYETLLEAPNWGIAPELIPPAVTEYLRTSNDVVRRYTEDHEKRYTTEAVLKSEERLLRNVEKLQGRRGPRADARLVAKILAKEPSTTAEQIKAVNHLTQSRGSIRLVDGLPGTGKTRFVLKTCCKIWKKQGYRVIGVAPTGKAACELEAATGISADTIHMHLCDFDKKYGFVAKHHLKQLVRAARGKRTYKYKRPKPLHVDKKTIVLVDEGGMVNTRQWRMLTKLVDRGGGMIAGIGDRYQLPPVEGSAPFQSLCSRVGFAKLTDIRRQRDEWAREAVKLFREGRTGEALELYAERGLVNVQSNMDEALTTLVSDWTEVGAASPEKAMILVATNEQSEEANRLCQQSRIDSGNINPRHGAKIIDHDKEKGTTYRNQAHVGDRILFTKNDRRLQVRNGFLGTVMKISPTGGTMTVRLDHGRTLPVRVKKYRHLRLSYAMTTYRAQGATTEETFILVSDSGSGAGSMQNLPATYVQASRAKKRTCFYTTKAMVGKSGKCASGKDLKEIIGESPLAKQMAKAPDLRLAVDLLDSDESESGNQEASEQQTAVPSEQLLTNATLPTAANTDATLPPPASHRQNSARSNSRDKREKRRLAAAALRRRMIERRRRQRHAYAVAQAEWERQRREYEIAQANLLASLSKYTKQTTVQTPAAALGEGLLAHYVDRLNHDIAESQTRLTESITTSPFADLFDDPSVQELPDFEPVKTPQPFLPDISGNRDRQEFADSDSSPRPVEQPTETYVPCNTTQDDDYDPWENHRSRCVAEQVGQRPASSWGSTASTHQSIPHTTSSVYTVYNETNYVYSTYQTDGAAQVWTDQQKTQTRIVPGSSPG